MWLPTVAVFALGAWLYFFKPRADLSGDPRPEEQDLETMTGRIDTLDELHPSIRSVFQALWDDIQTEGLPLRVWETYRTPERQDLLKSRGKSQLGGSQAPHPRRCAVDFVLDFRPPGHGRWWTGVDKDDEGNHTVLVDAEILSVWARLGNLIRDKYPSLEWGGDWASSGELIGWDPYHVQFRGWAALPLEDDVS